MANPHQHALDVLAQTWVASGHHPLPWRQLLDSEHLALVALGYTRNWPGDHGADVVQDVMLKWTLNPPPFEGRSAFSTYLFSVLKSARLETMKFYVPSSIASRGQTAKDAWKLLKAGWTSTEIVAFLEDQMPKGQVVDLVQVLREEHLRNRAPVKRAEEVAFSRLEWDEDGIASKPEDPLEQFAQADLLRLVLDRLTPAWQATVREYFLERSQPSFLKAGQAHGIANAPYEWEKIRKAFQRELG